jgi:RNA polymerase sigma factor (sigma-70 family)
MINIIVADDHNIVRNGLKALLNNEVNFKIIGEAANGLEAIETVERLKPDIAILDIMMPGVSGLEVTARLKKTCPKTGVIILSMHSNQAYVYEALRSGAKAYILKDNTADELKNAILEVHAGRCYFGPYLPEPVTNALRKKLEKGIFDPLEELSPRERQIMQLEVRGQSNSEIAEKLGISPRTVETHSNSLMRKIGVSNRNHLIQFALQHGIITADDLKT